MIETLLRSGIIRISVIAMILVFFAMVIDLICGLYKAKQRGEFRSSEALKRTLSKFISYEGGLIIASMADVMIYLCKMYELLGVEILIGVPLITCLIALFLLVVEWMSVRETADAKTRKDMVKATQLIQQIGTDALINTLAEAIQKANKNKGGQNGTETGENSEEN